MKRQSSLLKSFLYSLLCTTMIATQLVGSQEQTTENQTIDDDIQAYFFDRYFTAQGGVMKRNGDHLAPQPVQDLALSYAQAMDKENLYLCFPQPFEFLGLDYFKKSGFLTVYDGPPDRLPGAFDDDPSEEAFSLPQGGIFFRAGSFLPDQPLTPKHRFILCHEIAHVMNGDMTELHALDARMWSPVWFEHEYCAQIKAVETLYLLHDYEAIEAVILEVVNTGRPPYVCGTLDVFIVKVLENPDDLQLQAIFRKIGMNELWTTIWEPLLADPVNATWQTRYELCRQEWPEKFESTES